MNALVRYALSALLIVGVGAGVLWLLLEESSWRGALVAALVAYPVQMTAFWLLLRTRGEASRFFTWWGVGIGIRVAVVVAVGVLSSGLDAPERAALLLSLVGFFFVMLLMEPVFLKADRNDARTTV